MKSKTYFGEYSLSHWLNLILKRNIILPSYQRSFVWNHEDVEKLVNSFKTGQFIQPVTIARMKSVDGGINLILDGQQRLTSILLLALGYFPQKEKFKDVTLTAIDDDSSESDSMLSNEIIDWTFEILFKKDKTQNSLAEIKHRITSDDRYELLKFKNSDLLMKGSDLTEFLNKTFLGFSYIVPDSADKETEQYFFSTLFRNMNYLGKKLSPLESRKSLYYLNEKYKNYFEGRLTDGSEALGGLKIMDSSASKDIDFLRYLSTLSQYDETSTKASKIMVGYSSYSSRENYYADYVAYILKLEQDNRSDKFNKFSMSATFGDEEWEPRFARLKLTIENLKKKMNLDPRNANSFRSWIDADYWLFGLIYWIVFKDKQIDLSIDWTPKINEEIKKKKKNPNDSYVKTPNMLGHLRNRIERSIELIKKYAL